MGWSYTYKMKPCPSLTISDKAEMTQTSQIFAREFKNAIYIYI